ncbi:MAG: hypothetical protein LBF43_02485, partial [Puniceicoccales bacterium]|nr:hypothetical protein [Puniceicoccales bacterium]
MCAMPVGGDPRVGGGAPVGGGGAPAGPAAGAADLRPGGGAGMPPVGAAPAPITAPGGGTAAATLVGAEKTVHPHIDNDTVLDNLEAMMEPSSFDKAAHAACFKQLQDQGVIDKDGNIDFTKLGLSKRQIKRSGITGTAYVGDDGKINFRIRGECGANSVQALAAFKQAAMDGGVTLPINPSTADKPSPADLDVLRRGGQIQYRPGDTYTARVKTPDGGTVDVPLQNTVKITLDPGEKGGGDGLTLEVFDAAGNRVSGTPKVPLSAVFEGQEYNGVRVPPTLPQWRDQRLFENAQVHTQGSFLGEVTSNVDDVNRIQAQNNLWSGVMSYLNATQKAVVGMAEIDGGGPRPAGPEVGGPGDPAALGGVDRAAELNALYTDLNACLATPKDVTADGLQGLVD